jgi:hypothetical protein
MCVMMGWGVELSTILPDTDHTQAHHGSEKVREGASEVYRAGVESAQETLSQAQAAASGAAGRAQEASRDAAQVLRNQI